MNDASVKVVGAVLGTIIGLSLVHLIWYVITKLILFASYQVFEYSLYDKFWGIYAILVVIAVLFGGGRRRSYTEK